MFQRGSRGVPSPFEGFRSFSNPFFMGVPVAGVGAIIILICGIGDREAGKRDGWEQRCGREGGISRILPTCLLAFRVVWALM